MTIRDLAAALVEGDRRALARAITLIESTRPDDRDDAGLLLDEVLPRTGDAVRLGVSGPPGAGKSTFIQAYGLHLVRDLHQRVAVLAIDPSSTQSGGSILGDKTRMPDLAAEPDVFIRPSPAGASLGGLARRTREVLLVCEAAGYDHVLVETVGVGQSETAVAGITDTMALLLSPGAGDDLQGIKRGVMELADLIVVTKADGDLATAARLAAADARQGLALLRRRHVGWEPPVILTSAHQSTGVSDVAVAVRAHHEHMRTTGQLKVLRDQQALQWFTDAVTEGVLARFRQRADAGQAIAAAEAKVRDGSLSPTHAAQQVLRTWTW